MMPDPTPRREIRIEGRVASRGIGIGRAFCLTDGRFETIRRRPAPVNREIERLDDAVKEVLDQLDQFAAHSDGKRPDPAAEIFDIQRAIINDSSLLGRIREIIADESCNSEWAVNEAAAEYRERLRSSEDEHFRSLLADLDDVIDHLISALLDDRQPPEPPKDAVVITRELRPSTILNLAKHEPKAIVTEIGGWTSHSFIMARELGIPVVSGVRNALKRIPNDSMVAVDGLLGQVIQEPAADTVERLKHYDLPSRKDLKKGIGHITTADGVSVTIAPNVDNIEKCRQAIDAGVSSIGLIRSEYLFNIASRYPGEETQIDVYSKIVGLAGEKRVCVRTFDLNMGQLLPARAGRERNPALGLRSIRLSLKHERQFRIQLRSLISAGGCVDILLPLVSSADEVMRAREILADEINALGITKAKRECPRLGAMIEVPSAVLTIDAMLAAADFGFLGTNDLVQYLLGVDRDNEAVADWYQTLHPAVLKAIQIVVSAARRSRTPLLIGGEMAGAAYYAPILIGLGARELSMNLSSMPGVAEIIGSIDSDKAAELIAPLCTLGTAGEVENELRKIYAKYWPELLLTHPSTRPFERSFSSKI